MDFFALKRKHRQASRIFYGLFFLVVMIQTLLLMVAVGVVFRLWTGDVGVNVVLGSALLSGLYFVMGLLIAHHKTKQGGLSLAKAVGAVRLFVHGDNTKAIYAKTYLKVSSVQELPPNYRRYHEFAEQMAIASGVPLPKLYVLPLEMGVNGFVAGFGASDTVMVLTQGAVDKLSDHELYGLIGHEFGHLVQKDNELNLHIYTMMSMLSWVYDLADVMEMYIFGRFDKNYHDDVVMDGSRESWLNYLRHQQRKFAHAHAQSHINIHRHYGNYDGYDPQAPLFFPYLIAITPVVLFRLFGVMGMAAAEWVKSRFNQQREHLADAISIQLTRSDEVVLALQSLYRHDSVLQNPAFTASMSHFFFANPRPKGEWSKSHPDIDERCDVLMDVVGEFADVKIDRQAHKFHATAFKMTDNTSDEPAQTDERHPLLQNATTDEQGHTVVQYDGVFDVVRDGRLVVDDWAVWDAPSQFLPRLARLDETLLPQGAYLTLHSLKNANLPYTITAALTKPLPTLALIECVMCCIHHEQVGEQADLWAIYWGVWSDDKALCHQLPKELLKAVAQYDRRADKMLVVLALRQFVQGRFDQTQMAHAADKLQSYAQVLSSLLIKEPIITAPTPPHSPIKTLFCALVLSVLLRVLDKKDGFDYRYRCQDKYQDIKAYLGGHELSAFLLLLIFVASTQDNSLTLMRHDKITTSIRRWARLSGVAVMVDDKTLIELCHQVRAFGVSEWALVLMNVQGDMNTTQTLSTAFLFDGNITQDEYELIQLSSLLWQKGDGLV